MTSPGAGQHEENDQNKRSANADFSIDYILNRAGRSSECSSDYENVAVPFPWLHCTRYCPPKIPRMQKKDGVQKRQLGRHPRIPFTSHQLSVLEEKFQKTPYLSASEVTSISRDLLLADVRVKIWFQNRRARERRERPQPSMVTSDPVSTNSASTSPIRVLPENMPSTSFISYSPDSLIGPARTSPPLISHVDFNIHNGSILLSNLQVVYNKDNNR